MRQKMQKLITTIVILTIIVAINPIANYAQDKIDINILKTSEESYIIYIRDIINTEFLFSYSENKDTPEEELTFSASGLDTNEANVAYMTKQIAESFAGKQIYIIIKQDEKLETHEINLAEAITTENIEFVNSTTKRIEVSAEGPKNTNQEVDGVKITHSQGKVTITEQGNFSYSMIKVENEETTKFVEKANEIMASKELTNNDRLTLVKQFTKQYNQILEGIENWEQVPENKEILQPHESETGDIYLIYLKNNETGEHDVQILICDDGEDIEVEEAKKVTIYETVKLPITFDGIMTLVMALIILVIVILALIVLKKHLNKEKE